jgi:hypothetical protein
MPKIFDDEGEFLSDPNGTESWSYVEAYDTAFDVWRLWDSSVGSKEEAMALMKKRSEENPTRRFRVSTTVVTAVTTKSEEMEGGATWG